MAQAPRCLTCLSSFPIHFLHFGIWLQKKPKQPVLQPQWKVFRGNHQPDLTSVGASSSCSRQKVCTSCFHGWALAGCLSQTLYDHTAVRVIPFRGPLNVLEGGGSRIKTALPGRPSRPPLLECSLRSSGVPAYQKAAGARQWDRRKGVGQKQRKQKKELEAYTFTSMPETLQHLKPENHPPHCFMNRQQVVLPVAQA